VTSRPWRMRVQDILDAIEAIQSHTAGLTKADFLSSKLVTDAVERNFAVIGEAMIYVPEEVRDRHPEVAWREMRKMRNLVTQVYHAVDQRIVWTTIRQDLQPTADQLRKLLDDEPEEDAPDA